MFQMSPTGLLGPVLSGITLWRSPRFGSVLSRQVPPGILWLELILEGRVEPPPSCEDQSLAGPGALFWNPAGTWTVHRYPPDQPYVALALRFHVPEGPSAEPPIPRRSQWSDLGALRAFVAEVQQVRLAGTWQDPAFGGYAYHRLAWVALHHRQRRERNLPPPLERILDLIARQPAGDLSLTRLATVGRVSRSCVCEQFQRHLGTTPHDYITRHRIDQARQLLAETRLLIKEIAAATGFGTPSLFCRTFRRLVGVSPQVYRHDHGTVDPT